MNEVMEAGKPTDVLRLEKMIEYWYQKTKQEPHNITYRCHVTKLAMDYKLLTGDFYRRVE